VSNFAWQVAMVGWSGGASSDKWASGRVGAPKAQFKKA
jgi:hypothetical protein